MSFCNRGHGYKLIQQRLNRDLGRFCIGPVQVVNPGLQSSFGKLAIGRRKAVLFALAACLFYAIVGSVGFMTVQAWNIWDLGQKLPGAFRFFDMRKTYG